MQKGVAVGGGKSESGVIETDAEKPANQEQGGHSPAVRAKRRGAAGERDETRRRNVMLYGVAPNLLH